MVSELDASELVVSELGVSELAVSELAVSELVVSEFELPEPVVSELDDASVPLALPCPNDAVVFVEAPGPEDTPVRGAVDMPDELSA